MDEIQERQLLELLERDRIRETMARYARGIDRYDVDLVRSAFHADAVDCHGPVSVGLDEFVARVMPELKDREACQHFVHNQSIDLDGDTAHVETYFVVVRKRPGEDHVEQIGGRYVDRFERRNGEWRIALRTNAIEWSGLLPTMDIPFADVPGILDNGPACRGKEDISYRRPLTNRREPFNPAA